MHNIYQIRRRETGLTLVELLVAMVISGILLAGIMQIFLSTKQSYALQNNLARAQEDGRFAIQFLDRDIRMAGHPMNALPRINGFNDSSGLLDKTAPVEATNGAGEAIDQLVIQYQAPDALPPLNPATDFTARNCLGEGILEKNMVISRYFIDGDGLNCEALNDAGTAVSSALLISGVIELDVSYGEDTDADGAPNIYRNADNVANFSDVVSVTVRVRREVSKEIKDAGGVDSKDARDFTTTVPVRNQSRG